MILEKIYEDTKWQSVNRAHTKTATVEQTSILNHLTAHELWARTIAVLTENHCLTSIERIITMTEDGLSVWYLFTYVHKDTPRAD